MTTSVRDGLCAGTPPDPEVSRIDFDEFVRRNGGALLAFARRITLDHHRAEDVVQEALLRCHRHWDRIEPAAQSSYVYRAVVNEANSWWRRRWSRERPVEEVDDVTGVTGPRRPHVADVATGVTELDELRSALGQLSVGQRTVLALRYYLDRSDAEIAELTGWPLATVRSHARRGLVRLRDHLDPPSTETVQ